MLCIQNVTHVLYIQLHFFLSKYGTTNITNKAHPIANKNLNFQFIHSLFCVQYQHYYSSEILLINIIASSSNILIPNRLADESNLK